MRAVETARSPNGRRVNTCKKNIKMKDDFYIGWQSEAPDLYSKKIKRTIFVFIFLVSIVSALFVLSQKGFEDSVFEFGTLSEMEGILVENPFPMLKINGGNGKTESILLVGFGKLGAEKDISLWKKNEGGNIENKQVRISGTKIYHDGKTLLELTEGEAAFKGIKKAESAFNPKKENLGEVTLQGEILDPKCAFGVMKPAEGKPHRSCAVRCISGGIPPVFRMTNAMGEKNYCLLLGRDGQPVNSHVLEYVADQVRVCGRLEQHDDWLVLYTDPATEILRLQPYWMTGDVPMCNPN